jgi:uncharacterized damage-inducible protein DinB
MDRTSLLNHWPIVRQDLLKVMAALTDEDLAIHPVEGGWPIGRIMIHISSAAEYWLHSGILSAENVYNWQKNTLKNYPTLEVIKAYQAAEHERTMKLLSSFDIEQWQTPFQYPDGCHYKPDWIFWHIFEHEIHHRGELSLILGLLGRKGLDV